MKDNGQTYDQLETAFKHRNFKPVYLVYGEEQSLISGLERLLQENALQPHDHAFNLDVFYGPEADVRQVLAACGAFPVMAERRVVVVRAFEGLKDSGLVAEYAKAPNPNTVLWLSCYEAVNDKVKPYPELKKRTVWASIVPLKESQVPGWLQRQFSARGYEVQPEALQILADRTGTDLRRLGSEVEKLTLYVGDRMAISVDDVIRASGQTREHNVFELQRVISEGRYADAMRITERLLQQASSTRSEALGIVGVLTAYFIRLWKLSKCLSAGVPAARHGELTEIRFYADEYKAAVRRMGNRRIDEALAVLLAADYELKGGTGRDERLILALLIRRLTGGSPAGIPPKSTSLAGHFH